MYVSCRVQSLLRMSRLLSMKCLQGQLFLECQSMGTTLRFQKPGGITVGGAIVTKRIYIYIRHCI